MLANLLQALYGTADTVIVGQFADAAGLSACGNRKASSCSWSNGLIIGLSMGGTILIGRYFGAGQDNDINETIGTMLTFFCRHKPDTDGRPSFDRASACRSA